MRCFSTQSCQLTKHWHTSVRTSSNLGALRDLLEISWRRFLSVKVPSMLLIHVAHPVMGCINTQRESEAEQVSV